MIIPKTECYTFQLDRRTDATIINPRGQLQWSGRPVSVWAMCHA
jgi:hypothetical protein